MLFIENGLHTASIFHAFTHHSACCTQHEGTDILETCSSASISRTSGVGLCQRAAAGGPLVPNALARSTVLITNKKVSSSAPATRWSFLEHFFGFLKTVPLTGETVQGLTEEIWGLWRVIESLACVNRGDGQEVHRVDDGCSWLN